MEVTDQTVLEAWISEFYPLKSLHHPGFVKNEFDSANSLYWSHCCKYIQS